ncbi:LCP family protein [Lactococcus lactis]|uniref:Transcriptional regulator n=1 Tax=Lactococcus lactis subsp. lactis TaxID=1360 RepID=A0AAC9W9B2_LACLL|nr:LCP family protein [Lactococcus lactis]ARE13999.1 LCP family protein [Lactococcus lactis subsp. lactis]ARE16414.1 LCP family protein [Lactococcus lactis subsp. lactis]
MIPHRRKRNNKIKKMVGFLISLVIIIAVGVFGYIAMANHRLNNILDKGYHKVDNNYKSEKHKDTESFLIMGLDNTQERNLGTTRTDAMMIITINKKTKTTTFCSIPRDSFVQIDSKSYKGMQRIEAAYTYGGPSASVNTVEKTFNIPIDHYCVFNFNSFIKLIDAIGGIDIDVEKSFMGTDESGIESIKFNSGKQHLDGAKALSYARERHVDTDIMRGFRQQKVISAVEEKLKSMTSFTNLYSIIDSLDDNIQTDITPKDIKELISNALTFSNYSKQQLTFDWRTFSNQGRSMVELYKDSIKFVSHKLRVSLESDRKNETDNNGYSFHTNGDYLYQSDYTVQNPEAEAQEDTSTNGNTYIGTSGNTTTGPLPNIKTSNGFIK